MSSRVLPPNPSLVAVILITKTRSGVHHVFHYPPNPGKDKPHIKLDYEDQSEDSSSSSDDDSSESSWEDEKSDQDGDARRDGIEIGPDMDESGSASPEKIDRATWERRKASREGFLGLPSGLQHFLCPSSANHKKRFELSIDRLVFLGWPVFSKDNGEWRRKKTPKAKAGSVVESVLSPESTMSHELEDGSKETSAQGDGNLGESTEESTDVEDQSATEATNIGPAMTKSRAQAKEDETGQKDDVQELMEILNMFHVVFVMNPPALEYHLRVDEMYKHVAKKFSRALKWEQARSNYVLNEAAKIRELQAKHGSFINSTE